MTASAQCPHSDVHCNFNLVSFDDTNVRYLEVVGHCNVCQQPMIFRGLPLGLSPDRPTASAGGEEVRLPMMFGEEEYDGRGIGFLVSAAHG